MTHKYSFVRCPNCNDIAETKTTRGAQVLFGCPFRVCKVCGHVYFDGDYKEEGIYRFLNKGGSYGSLIPALFLTIAAIIITINWIKYAGNEMVWVLIGIWIITLPFDIYAGKVIANKLNTDRFHEKTIDLIEGRKGKMDKDLKASMNRLSNKRYLDALKAHGVDVPEYFYQRLDSISNSNNNQLNSHENEVLKKAKETTAYPPVRAAEEKDKRSEPQPPLLVADELTKLKSLLDAGVLTEEEFAQQKAKLLGD